MGGVQPPAAGTCGSCTSTRCPSSRSPGRSPRGCRRSSRWFRSCRSNDAWYSTRGRGRALVLEDHAVQPVRTALGPCAVIAARLRIGDRAAGADASGPHLLAAALELGAPGFITGASQAWVPALPRFAAEELAARGALSARGTADALAGSRVHQGAARAGTARLSRGQIGAPAGGCDGWRRRIASATAW